MTMYKYINNGLLTALVAIAIRADGEAARADMPR